MPTDSDSESLPLRSAYTFFAGNGLADEAEQIRTSRDHLGSYTSTLRRAKVTALLRRNNLVEKFISAEWPFGATEEGKRKISRYDRIFQRFESAKTHGDESTS